MAKSKKTSSKTVNDTERATDSATTNGSRTRVSQTQVPAHTLTEALRVAQALADSYALQQTRPLAVAQAMGMKPTSGGFRSLCGASIAYGLTDGGYNAPFITITQLGKRIVAPTSEGDDELAKREATLRPEILGEFLRRYDGAKFPSDSIAQNVLHDMGVPRPAAARVLEVVKSAARDVGFLREIRGTVYVDLGGVPASEVDVPANSDQPDPINLDFGKLPFVAPTSTQQHTTQSKPLSRKIFITHGKNRSFIDPLKQLLAFGELEPVVAVESQAAAKAVPDKLMAEMRECSGAIIHIDAERRLLDQEGEEQLVLNPNVLIEVGAALALFGKRFILLVRDTVTLPSNLQGLYQVRYTGEALDGDATIRLLKAINEMKKEPLPSI